MNLQTLKNRNSEKGFTIVELLIVIVVIAILAAISIVYTVIQNRAKTSSGQQLASQVEKKALAFFTVNNRYPDDHAGFSSVPEARLEGISSAQLLSSPVASNTADNGKAVSYVPYGTSGARTGATIGYWDFTAGSIVPKTIGTC